MSHSSPSHPLHDSVRTRLDPEYVDFYERYLINLPQVQDLPLSVSRAASPIAAGGGKPVPVGETHDFVVDRKHTQGPPVEVRAFCPQARSPLQTSNEWPAVLYLHGGGFVFGCMETENTLCSHLCVRAQCIVLAVNYRLAPESPFPAPIDDGWEVLSWMVTDGPKYFNIDLGNTAIAGASAGANIAMAIAQRALSIPREVHRFSSQLLVVPVADHTATIHNNPTWKELQFTASLTAKKMTWYRHQYLPREQDRSTAEASPLFMPSELMSQLPPTTILVAELDILRHEGTQYAQKLEEAGVPVEFHVMPGVPHPFIAMDAVLTIAREGISLLCDSLSRTFQSRYNGVTVETLPDHTSTIEGGL